MLGGYKMMEYAKDEVFNVCYLNGEDKLKGSLGKRIIRKIRNNKIITFLITMGSLFSILNFTLIFYFFELLSKI